MSRPMPPAARLLMTPIPTVAAITLVLVMTACPASARDSRPRTNVARLTELSREFEARWARGRDARYRAILETTDPVLRARLTDPNVQLMRVDDNGRAVWYRFNDLVSARTIAADDVWPGGSAGFSLDGNRGLFAYLAQWDAGGVVTNHQEFGGRVTQVEPAANHFHSTRVAGIMMASGFNPQASGTAPGAELWAFTSANDDAEMAMVAAQGLHVSNHSYSLACGWDLSLGTWTWFGDINLSTQEDPEFGRYSDQSRSWDEIAFNAPFYTIVGGAGNDRDDNPVAGTPHLHPGNVQFFTDIHPPDGGTTGYDTMPSTKCGKNIITVGGVQDIANGWTNPGSVISAAFSGWGPADDGRIKPDVVANATSLTAPDTGSVSNYATNANGCSYAGPAVAGAVTLMLQHWDVTHGSTPPLSSTVKAILIHTADEAGTTGPDYVFGWGLVDTREAVELVDEDRGVFSERILEQTLQQGASDTVEFYWGAEGPFSVSMAWTDPPGTVVPVSVDDTTPMLVNDLDLRVKHVPTGASYSPWILDVGNPQNAAGRGDNSVDNVEQVRVDLPAAGWYRAIVTHKGTLDGLEQVYSLILPARRKVCLTAEAVVPPNWGLNPGLLQHWANLDGDAMPDLVLSNLVSGVKGFSSRGNGEFTKRSAASLDNLDPYTTAVWEDFDNDGDADCVVGGDTGRFRIWVNNLAALDSCCYDPRCGQPNEPPGCDTMMVLTPVDVDASGRTDLLAAAGDGSTGFYRNLGNFEFDFQPLQALGLNGTIEQYAWANIDGDARPELFIVRSDGANRLFDATGGGYSEITIPGTGTQSYGAAWGYLDDNAIPDLFVANAGEPDQLLLGTPSGFVLANLPMPDPANGSRPGVVLSDVDLDGDVDALLVHRGRILINIGNGIFAPGPMVDTGMNSSASWSDPAMDGRPDLFLGGVEGSHVLAFDPCDPDGRWLEIDLQGSSSTRSALGAVITVDAGPQTLRRQVGVDGGARAQGPLRQHFGLGAAAVVNLRVDWPSGAVSEFAAVAANQVLSLQEPGSSGVPEVGDGTPLRPAVSLRVPVNPVLSTAEIELSLTAPAPVRVDLFSVDGRRVRALLDERRDAGLHTVRWDGRDDSGRMAAAGIYFVRASAGGNGASTRIVLVR